MPPWLRHLREDLGAGVVVFLVAVPLCIGIASASGAPLLAGLVAGVVGGVVVGAVSGSALSVSGPAAGLVAIVAAAIERLGYPAFLVAVMLSGAMQVGLGAARAGGLAHFFPSSVIKGMLAAIGVILVLKQLPHAVGYDHDFEGDFAFAQKDGENTLDALVHMFGALHPVAVAVSLLGAAVLWGWPLVQARVTRLAPVPAALVVVVLGGVVASLVTGGSPALVLAPEHLVSLPVLESWAAIRAAVVSPDWAALSRADVWSVAVTLALVASLESLLSLEAVDRIDPHHRISPPNRELVAQGVGNLVSGALGGLPVTAVIVRSSANVHAGGRTKLASIVHGVLLLLGALLFARLLNRVPLAALAAILIAVGLKLVKPAMFRELWAKGRDQFVPFAVTLGAVVLTDLLTGTLIGLAVGLFFVLRANTRNAVRVVKEGDSYLIRLEKDATFLHKLGVKTALAGIPEGAYVILDGTRPAYIDADILEVLADFETEARASGVTVERRVKPSANNPHFRGVPS